VAASVSIRAGTSITAQDIEATNGTVLLNGSAGGSVGSITAGNVRATGNLSLTAGNSGTAQFASLTSTGGGVLVSGFVPGVLAVTGDIIGTSVNIGAVNQLLLANVTSTAGVINLIAFRGSIAAGNLSANGGNVSLSSAIFGSINPANEFVNVGNVSSVGGNVTINVPGAVTTTGISATGLIDVDSTGVAGDLMLGNVSAGLGITLDADGDISAGTVASTGGAIAVGLASTADSVTFGGAANARSISVLTSGAFQGAGLTSTAGCKLD
jgi:hypothetical protein